MKKVATLKLIDEINMLVLGITKTEQDYFYDKFGYFADGYIFKYSYTIGRWDGKTRLYSATGKTSIHFADQIVPELQRMGYTVKIMDNRNPIVWEDMSIDANTFAEQGVVLESHQVISVNALLENKGGIVVAATGAGKSYMIGALLNVLHKQMGLRFLVIVPTLDLVTQTAAEVILMGNDTGMYSGTEKNLSATHLVSTWQSLQNNPNIIANYSGVIIDEAHGAKSSVLKSLLTEYAKKAVFIAGVTGTLPKHEADLESVRYALGSTVHTVEGHELIDNGWLAKLNLYAISLKEDFTVLYAEWKEAFPEEAKKMTLAKFKAAYFPDYAAEKRWLQNHKDRNDFLADLIKLATTVKGNSFVLVNGLAFARRLSKLIPNSIVVHGNDSSEIRKQIYDLYDTNNDMVVIATYTLASTGLNIKRIFNLFMIDPNKSFIQVVQSIGRGLRKAVDKTEVLVWDISSDTKYSKKHAATRKSYYVEKKYAYKLVSTAYDKHLASELIAMISPIDIDMRGDIVVY